MNIKTFPIVIGICFTFAGCGFIPQTAAIPIDAADPCEYAKQVVVQADKRYRERDIAARWSKDARAEELAQARATMRSLCEAEDKDESESWACAEGHSCR